MSFHTRNERIPKKLRNRAEIVQRQLIAMGSPNTNLIDAYNIITDGFELREKELMRMLGTIVKRARRKGRNVR